MLTPLFTNFIFSSPPSTRLNRKKDRNRVSAGNRIPVYIAQPIFVDRVLLQRNLLVSFLIVGCVCFEVLEALTIKAWPISAGILHISYTLRPFQSELHIHHPNQERSCRRIALGISIKNKSLPILKILVVSSIICFHHFLSSSVHIHAITSSQNRNIINNGKIIITLDKSYFEEVFYG
jgi:hypothetical protein